MDPIGNLNPVLDALRRQLAENIERLRKSGKLGAGARAGQTPERIPAEGLEAIVRRKVAGLDRSPTGRAHAARAFVEAVLVAEFGDAMLSDPALSDMLSELSAFLREDPQIREQLDGLLGDL